MSKTVPSSQMLQFLRRACAIELSATSSRVHQRHQSLSFHSGAGAHTPQRGFSTAPRRRQQAQTQRQHSSSSPESSQPAAAPPDITNYYTLFPSTLPKGPPPSSPFTIPLPTLRREFLSLQAKHHPDKSPPGTSAHKTSLALSSLLNTAYKTLSDPLLRARYLLLEKYGIDVTSEDNSIHNGLTDQETLLEVMEAQEALEEATTPGEIEVLIEENKTRIKETEDIIAQAFESEDVEAAKRECVRLNYWQSLQGALKEWEPGKEVRLVH